MVNRFTSGAQAVLSSAKKNAEKMGHSYIGTEHLILGMLCCECTGKRVLEEKKISYDDFYARLTEIAGVGKEDTTHIKELTPKCRKIIESSAVNAKRFNKRLIGTEHLLYSICEEGESVGGRILTSMGVNLQILKNELAALLDYGVQDKGTGKYGIGGMPMLSSYGRSLNAVARNGSCDPLIGRDKELDRLTQVLCRRTKNNPCLIGEPGVGKTAIVEGLAERINSGAVPKELIGKTIFSLDLSSMIAGAKYRGEFEERMKGIMNELKANPSIILFIDELHTIIGAGAAEGAVDAANIIKPALARGQLQIIGATTIDEYRLHIEKDAALERRFQPVNVDEPSEEETINILLGLKERYELFHHVQIPNDTIRHAVKLSVRYINDRFLPDKAIDIIDEACARVKMSSLLNNGDGKSLDKQLDLILKDKEQAILNEHFNLASELKEKERKIRLQMEAEAQNFEADTFLAKITKEDVETIVSQWTKTPVSSLEKSEQEKLLQLQHELSCRVIGQDKAINTVAASIKRGRAGLKNPKRPIGSFLFLGPTGVGKTELAKAISEVVFGSCRSLIRLDMSEYTEKHSVSRLIGSPPGYVGYENGGSLTKAVKKRPYSVVLFDEIEKAHPDIYNVLLQILDEGILTESSGKQVSFKNTIIILTSNIGAKSIVKPSTLGFGDGTQSRAESKMIAGEINNALKNEFSPEFLNRLDEVVIFEKLDTNSCEMIAEKMLEELGQLSKDIGISLSFDKNVPKIIAQDCHDKQYGARPIRRAITALIENPLSEKIIAEEIKSGDDVSVFVKNDRIEFQLCNNASIPRAR